MSEEAAEKKAFPQFKVQGSAKKIEVTKKRAEEKDNPEEYAYLATALHSLVKQKKKKEESWVVIVSIVVMIMKFKTAHCLEKGPLTKTTRRKKTRRTISFTTTNCQVVLLHL